jgi:biopolymer transport protein ExbD
MAIATVPDEVAEAGSEPIFADINITPLTDVFLVLVVIFMVGAIAVHVERCVDKPKPSAAGIAVNPPPGRQHDIDPTQASLVLELSSGGGVYVGGKSFTDNDLDRVFRAAARRPQTQVVLRADRGIQLDRVIQVMERARALGLGHIAIGTRAP